MDKRIIEKKGKKIAIIYSDVPIVTEAQEILDLIGTVQYYDCCDRLIINQSAFEEDFFKLSTGVAGEVLQKVINYQKKLAIVGDFRGYKSKAFQDFIYESNKGNAIFFVCNEEEAIEKLIG